MPQPSTAPVIQRGIATYLGLATTILGALAAIVAGADGNDTATVTAGLATILATIATMGGRYAQSVTAIKYAASDAAPLIDAAQEALADEPGNDQALSDQGVLPEDLGEPR